MAQNIGHISDKDLKDFADEVLFGDIDKDKYYAEENIKEKQNFYLSISDIVKEKQSFESPPIDAIPSKNQDYSHNDTESEDNEPVASSPLTPEEEQKRLQSQKKSNGQF